MDTQDAVPCMCIVMGSMGQSQHGIVEIWDSATVLNYHKKMISDKSALVCTYLLSSPDIQKVCKELCER